MVRISEPRWLHPKCPQDPVQRIALLSWQPPGIWSYPKISSEPHPTPQGKSHHHIMMQSQALQVLILVQVRLLHLQDELMKLWILLHRWLCSNWSTSWQTPFTNEGCSTNLWKSKNRSPKVRTTKAHQSQPSVPENNQPQTNHRIVGMPKTSTQTI